MSSDTTQPRIRPSIIDRLIDDAPDQLRDGERSNEYRQFRELTASVRRDLENLLNTRVRIIEPDEKYPQLKTSLLNYGFPDLATVTINSQNGRKQFLRQIESLLIEYEPRFKSVSVHFEEEDSLERSLRFRIEAVIYADPEPLVVEFDSELDPASSLVNVAEAING